MLVLLFLFGRSVEGKLGHIQMAGLYALGLVGSDLAQSFYYPLPYSISYGASGAVGALCGAYWFLFTRSRMKFLYWWIFPGTTWCAVHWGVIYLFIWDVLSWVVGVRFGFHTGVAYSSHLGGLVSGLLLGLCMRQLSYVTLDGDDMVTRVYVWWQRLWHGKVDTPPGIAPGPIWVDPRIHGGRDDPRPGRSEEGSQGPKVLPLD